MAPSEIRCEMLGGKFGDGMYLYLASYFTFMKASSMYGTVYINISLSDS